MKRSLQDAIEKLYMAFANAPKPKTIQGCPCCVGNKQIEILLAKPLRQITPDELYSYAFSVFLTVGAEIDFKHFLPRIFDLLITDSDFCLDPEVAFRKFRYVRLQEWQPQQKLASANLIESVFVDLVLSPEVNEDNYFDLDPDTWLCAIARSGIAIEPLLKRLEQHPVALINLYEQNSQASIKGKLSNGFWNDIPNARQTVVDWFQSSEVQKLIDRQYFNS